MEQYIVKKSFFVSPNSQINWDATEHGTEGCGIPVSFLRKREPNEVFLVLVKSRGMFYKTTRNTIEEHDRVWHTKKTAPPSAQRLFIIIPVDIMEFLKFTPEKEATISKKMTIPEKPQQSLFSR